MTFISGSTRTSKRRTLYIGSSAKPKKQKILLVRSPVYSPVYRAKPLTFTTRLSATRITTIVVPSTEEILSSPRTTSSRVHTIPLYSVVEFAPFLLMHGAEKCIMYQGYVRLALELPTWYAWYGDIQTKEGGGASINNNVRGRAYLFWINTMQVLTPQYVQKQIEKHTVASAPFQLVPPPEEEPVRGGGGEEEEDESLGDTSGGGEREVLTMTSLRSTRVKHITLQIRRKALHKQYGRLHALVLVLMRTEDTLAATSGQHSGGNPPPITMYTEMLKCSKMVQRELIDTGVAGMVSENSLELLKRFTTLDSSGGSSSSSSRSSSFFASRGMFPLGEGRIGAVPAAKMSLSIHYIANGRTINSFPLDITSASFLMKEELEEKYEEEG